jgi:CheY-like chemotaxis protein
MTTKIAILENNLDNLNLMVQLLSASGFYVVSAIDGEIGLQLIEEEKPDLIICNTQLPKFNGFHIIKKIRGNHSLNYIPIIALKTYPTIDELRDIIDAGFDHFISKPIDPATFVEYIKEKLPTKKAKISPNQAIDYLKNNRWNQTTNKDKNLTVLILDDTFDNLKMMDILLGYSGYQTILTETAEMAWGEVEKKLPDLIISDLHLPFVNGLEFVEKLKTHEVYRHVPVVMISASEPTTKERQKSEELGVLQFITRPMDPTDLISMINEISKKIPRSS